MNHIGIDLGGRESQVCVRTPTGEIVHEKKQATAHLGELLAEVPASRVILETCAEAFAIARQLKRAGHDVRVVPATVVRTLGVGARGVKTDKRDARALSEASCKIELQSVHVPSEDCQHLRSLLQLRQQLVTSRTAAINAARGYLRTRLIRLRAGGERTLTERVRQALESHGGTPPMLERQLKLIEFINQQLAAAEAELVTVVKASPVCQLLMTAPGVGPVTAARFMSAIDDPKRFQTARQVRSYLGLTPGEDSSSERQRRTGITKAGPTNLRANLVQGAWWLIRCGEQDPVAQWAKQLMMRRPKQVVVCAVARKMAGILWAMWRNNKPYDADLLGRQAAPPNGAPAAAL
jgi:transposase